MTGARTLRVDRVADRVSVFTAAGTDPVLVQNAAPDTHPFIHPIVAPGGSASVTEDAPDHHPWQHGLSVGFNDVNGAGFWLEGLHPLQSDDDGTFHPRILSAGLDGDDVAHWSVETEYRDKRGGALLRETQDWRFSTDDHRCDLDLTLTLRARTHLAFGAYPYGGLFIRMPYRPEVGGRALNSEGLENEAAEGRRARWVSIEMPVPGADAGVAVVIFDHPGNREHPVPWRVDGQLGVVPSVSIAGAWELGENQEETFRYRVVVFSAPAAPPAVEAAWNDYALGATV